MSVTLLAFGRRGYAAAATNMVASIRHYGYTGRIHLLVGAPLRHMIPADILAETITHELPEHLTRDPGWCKVNLPGMITEPTLYLDVDGIVLKDITPLVDALRADGRHYITCVMGKGGDAQEIQYYAWATQATVKKKHSLPDDATYYGIQSSWAWMVPGEKLDTMQATMLDAWGRWTVQDLRYRWGGTMPDELMYSIACTLMRHDPSWPEEVAFWGRGFHALKDLKERHYVMTLHGSGRGAGTVPHRYVEHYDHLIRHIFKARGTHPPYAASVIRRDKWVDHGKTSIMSAPTKPRPRPCSTCGGGRR